MSQECLDFQNREYAASLPYDLPGFRYFDIADENGGITSPVLDYAYANILKSNIHSKFKLLLAPGFYMGKLGSKYNFCVAETLPQESAIALCLSGIDWKQFAKVITAKSYSSFPS